MGKFYEQALAGDIGPVMAVDPWAWAYYGKLRLNGGEYTVDGHEYQIDPMQCEARNQCAKKATQTGWTEVLVIRALHAMKHGRYPQGALYLFPTSDEVTDFSSSRFKPFLSDNYDQIGRYVKDTDRANLKQIGEGFLFFRGARLGQKIEGQKKSSSKLKSMPCDAVYFDEFDEMDPESENLALARMEHSDVKETFYLANPTIPDFGIDKKYQNSDQRVWALKCQKCGKYTCLELEFPNCLKHRAGKLSSAATIINVDQAADVYRACKKCGAEIFPRDGIWVAQYPSRTNDLVGWWISHLNSKYKSPREMLELFEDPKTNKSDFYNLNLGMAYIAAENRLTHNQVYACCGNDVMSVRSDAINGAGIDVGKNLHITIGHSPSPGRARILKIVEVSSFNDAYDLFKQFNVKCAVFDLYPETRKVRSFRGQVRYPVFGCAYSEHQKGAFAWDENSGVVTVNRTELCDATHDLVVSTGALELPRRDSVVEEFAKQLCNIAKVLDEDKQTGTKIYRYRKLGPDHYRHSLNYLSLALLKLEGSVSRTSITQTQPQEFYYG